MKQISMLDYPQFCERKADYPVNEDKMELLNNLFDGQIEITRSEVTGIMPKKQESPIINTGRYIRDIYDRVFKIDNLGKIGMCMDKAKTIRYKDGHTEMRSISKYYKNFYVVQYLDGEKLVIPMTEFEVSESHELLEECLYDGDSVYTEYGRMKIENRLESKKKGRFFLCSDYHGKRRLLRGNEIKGKVNELIRASSLEVGYKVRHKNYGWFTVKKVWSKKVEVTKKDGTSFMIYEWDIVDIDEGN